MPEPFSIGLMAGYAALAVLTRTSTAVSKEAGTICSSLSCVVEAGESSIALFGDKAKALAQLYNLADECSETGWDGTNAEPIAEIAKRNVEHFIRLLPADVPLPEFSPEPDGAISMDWIKARNRLFSVSVGLSDRLAFAWLDGTDRGHGVARFTGDSVPNRILDGIKSITHHDDSLLRVA